MTLSDEIVLPFSLDFGYFLFDLWKDPLDYGIDTTDHGVDHDRIFGLG